MAYKIKQSKNKVRARLISSNDDESLEKNVNKVTDMFNNKNVKVMAISRTDWSDDLVVWYKDKKGK